MCCVVEISVVIRPPAVKEVGCHVVSFLAAAGILMCMHDQARHVKKTVHLFVHSHTPVVQYHALLVPSVN